MSLVRHSGRTNTQYGRPGDRSSWSSQAIASEARRKTYWRQQARRAVARQALARGWSPAETREVLDALGLLISPAAMRGLIAKERAANAGALIGGRSRPGPLEVPIESGRAEVAG